jgi:hypothetical protein
MSYEMYGGHASIHLRYDSSDLNPTYKFGEDTSKQSVAYLQVGAPTYRISQMIKNGGNILDAYGYVTVISPCGLPIRGIIGIRSDPMMMVAINCNNLDESVAFYKSLGFVEVPYPYARPSNGKGQFEPPQEPKSVYLSFSPNSMGLLLLPTKNKKKGPIQPNRSIRSLSIVYDPTEYNAALSDESENKNNDLEGRNLIDPSGVPVSFLSVSDFEQEQKMTTMR